MQINIIIKIMLLVLWPLLGIAGKAIFILEPVVRAPQSLASGQKATAVYKITNNTPFYLNGNGLNDIPAGLRQVVTTESCANPFNLVPGGSCLLNLELDANTMQGGILGGPRVCNTLMNPIYCSQPNEADKLNIRVSPAPSTANITVANSPLTLTIGAGTGMLRITNASKTLTANNIAADFSGTILEGNVIQDASQCTLLPPTQSCTLIFTPTNTAVTLTSFPIKGSNTNQISGAIEVVAPTIAPIVILDSPLILQGTNGTPVPGSLTVRNNSLLLTATDIMANLTGTALDGNVTQDATGCAILLPTQTCQLMFIPGDQAVPATNISISGSNTSQTSASIAVNAPPQANITITLGSPLTLEVNGAAGTMTIRNDSTTEIAENIAANFVGTDLNGNVTQDASACTSVLPTQTCVLSFTPGATGVAQTNLPISGTDTTTATGTIQIDAHFAYITAGNIVTRCTRNPTTGALTSCGNSGAVPQSGNTQSISLNATNTFAYIGSVFSAPITQCNLNAATGGLSNCINAGASSIATSGIALNTVNQKSYLSSSTGINITVCDVNASTGQFSNCVNGPATGATAFIITDAANQFAYAVRTANTVFRCPINTSTGALTTCSSVGSAFSGSTSIALSPNGSFAYVTNTSTNSVTRCNVDTSTGNLTGCVDSGALNSLNGPAGIAIDSNNQFAYIINTTTSGSVTVCSIDQSTFDLIGCQFAGVNTAAFPTGIALL